LTVADENELVLALGRAFPSLAGHEPAESWRRAEGLGLFMAGLWSAGQAALAQRGIVLPPEVWEGLAPEAARAAQARRGGVAFLVLLRGALRDGRFGALVAAVGPHYVRASQARPLGAQTRAHLEALPIDTVAYDRVDRPETPPAASQRPRFEIAGFEIQSQLGEGAMGKVFKARQKSLDRFVALKVLAPQLASDEDFVRRFEREGRAAAKIDHPNVVRVIDQGRDAASGYFFIAFEFIDGQTLQEKLNARDRFPEKEALAIARGLSEALAAAEKAAIVHRDVKPGNIIIAKDGVPKLVDLGLAKKLDEKGVTASVNYIMGTPAFISPEAATGKEVDHRSDLYSLGMTLFRLVTGRLAHEASSPGILFHKHINEDCPDPRSVDPSISEGTARIILKLSARVPDDRYAQASDVVRDVDLVLAGKPPLLGAAASFAPSARPAAAGGMVPEDPSWMLELVPASIPDVTLGPPPPSDPAEAVLRALERSGDPEELASAIVHFQEAMSDARVDALSSAKAEAALARAYLFRGDRANADLRANAALDKDPRSRAAVDVLWRAMRGDAERCKLELALAQIKNALSRSDLDLARKLADRVREAYPNEPHPYLALAVIARLAQSEADFVDGLRRAWSVFPSKERGDVTLGGLDGLAADVLAAHGRSAYKGDGSLLKATLDGLDDKANLIAGALRMAIAVARVALERGNLTLFEQRRLHFAMARALAGLRRYDGASDELARATQFKPSEPELAAIELEKNFLTYMKHMLETQGAPRQKEARYRCLGAQTLVAAAQARLLQAGKERAARVFEIEKIGVAVADLARKDPAVRAEIRLAAKRLGQGDPFEQLEPAEKELAEIAAERAGGAAGEKPKAQPEPGPGRTGFFSKLKSAANAAAAGVAGAAREAQLMLRETQANARLDSATKRFASIFAKDLARDSKNRELQILARRAASLDTQAVVFADEEARARKDVERLSAHI
jgi:predicted Ser/Thr protein kinase